MVVRTEQSPGDHNGSAPNTSAAGANATATATPRPATLKAELLAQRHTIDLAQVPASGEKITEADVQAYLAARDARPLRLHKRSAAASPSHITDLVDDRYPAHRPQRILIVGGGNGAVRSIDALARLAQPARGRDPGR